MRILYLPHRIPYPPNKGDKIRSFHEIKFLSEKHSVDLACLYDDVQDRRHQEALTRYCRRLRVEPLGRYRSKWQALLSFLRHRPLSVGYFYSRTLQKVVDGWLSSTHYDAIICFCSPLAEYVFRSKFLSPGKTQDSRFKAQGKQGERTDRLSARAPRLTPKLIMDFCDVDSDKWLQYSWETSFPLSWIYRREHRLLLQYEKRVNQSFHHSVFASDQERRLFSSLFAAARKLTAIPNGVDHAYFAPRNESASPWTSLDRAAGAAEAAPVLVFTGVMDYYANVEGVTWFCNEVLPQIQRNFPKAQFYIVGSRPTNRVRRLGGGPGVWVTGYVEDVRPYYEMADVCVVPLRLARGVQNKVLEAMSMGKAVISTPKANQGIGAQDGRHLLLAENAPDFAKGVSNLLKDPYLRARLGEESRAFVLANCDWNVNMRELERILYSSPDPLKLNKRREDVAAREIEDLRAGPCR